ncbi:ABC transporter ATP-binding protein [Stomatohabitans albus]|uniref:ABC transporter ATP-binding protein n=1 Tax=Stomatohabitans albus TaxID=3110766 RepID=UPI00300C1201
MITFNSVSKIYPSGAKAVEDFSLEISTGETLVLVGSSGSGKTTLLRMINRMEEPTEGQVLINDEDVSSRDPVILRRNIGYVPQNAGLMPHQTVLENVAILPILQGYQKNESRDKAGMYLEMVGIDQSMWKRYPTQLSGGQAQRVAVARALACEGDILLMDEPFGAVDPIVRRELQDQVKVLKEKLDKSIVFVTHDIEEAFYLGTRIVILKKGGEVAQVGTPQEISEHPEDEFVSSFIGDFHHERMLHIVNEDGRNIVVDESDRAIGVISE